MAVSLQPTTKDTRTSKRWPQATSTIIRVDQELQIMLVMELLKLANRKDSTQIEGLNHRIRVNYFLVAQHKNCHYSSNSKTSNIIKDPCSLVEGKYHNLKHQPQQLEERPFTSVIMRKPNNKGNGTWISNLVELKEVVKIWTHLLYLNSNSRVAYFISREHFQGKQKGI